MKELKERKEAFEVERRARLKCGRRLVPLARLRALVAFEQLEKVLQDHLPWRGVWRLGGVWQRVWRQPLFQTPTLIRNVGIGIPPHLLRQIIWRRERMERRIESAQGNIVFYKQGLLVVERNVGPL